MAQSMYDPEEGQIEDLNSLYKSLLTQRLRAPGGNWGDALFAMGDIIGNASDRNTVMKQKADLIKKNQEQLEASMPDASPAVRQLMGSAHTRPVAMEMYKEERKRAQDRKDFADYQKVRGDATIPAPKFGDEGFAQDSSQRALPRTVAGTNIINKPYAELIADLRHPNPNVREEAKNVLEHFHQKSRKVDELYPTMGAGGQTSYGLDPNANAALAGQAGIKAGITAATTLAPADLSRGPSGNVMPQSIATMLNLGGPPTGLPTGRAPVGNTPAYPGPVPATTQAPNAAMPPPPPPSSGGAAPPNLQSLLANPQVNAGIKALDQAIKKQDFQGASQIATQLVQFGVPDQLIKQVAANAGGQAPPQGAGMPPQGAGMPPQGAGMPEPRPVPRPSYNPEQHKADIAENTLRLNGVASAPRVIDTIQELRSESPNLKLAGPMGPLGKAAALAETVFTGKQPQELGDLEAWESKLKRQVYPTLRQLLGPQFTAKEGEDVTKTWGGSTATTAGREKILSNIQKEIERGYREANWHNEAVQVGADPSEYLRQRYEFQRRMQGNPNQPGAAAPAPTSGQVAKPDFEPGVMDFFGKVFNPSTQEAQDVGRNIVSLPKSLVSSGGRSAAVDAYKNIATGARQLADVIPGVPLSDRSGVAAEQARQAKMAAENPDYNAASILHGIANPTALVGGTTMAIPKVLAAAATQGAMRPQTSLAKQFEEGATNAIVAAPFALAAKAIPATGKPVGYFARETPPPTELEQQAQRFGVSPTNAQLNPGDLISKIAGGPADRVAHGQQIRQITESLLAEAGSKAKVLSNEALATRAGELSDEFKAVFNKTEGAPLTSQNASALRAAIDDNPQIEKLVASGEAPTLAALRQAIEDASQKGTWIKKFPLDKLHRAWLEIGDAAGHHGREAGALREVIMPIIEEGLKKSGKPAGTFERLNNQWGALQDLKKVWGEGVGRGVGEASDTLRPTAIEQFAKEMPAGSSIKEAGSLTHGYGIRDFGETPLNLRPFNLMEPGSWKAAAEMSPDWLLKLLNTSATGASPGTKKMLELLRAGVSRGSTDVSEELRSENATR